MPGSKDRMRWGDVPVAVQRGIESVAGGDVVAAQSQPGGFSPGLASRLSLAGGVRVFAKAINSDWPVEAGFHRSEAAVAASLPAGIPAPRFLGSFDDGDWIALMFDDVAGRSPGQPWRSEELTRVLQALADLSQAGTPSPIALDAEHPRLGGWQDLSRDEERLAGLRQFSTWAADRLSMLLDLERDGLGIAKGDSLVHCDLYPHNILLTDQRVYLVDWPHARLGSPIIDLVSVLSTVSAAGIDPTPIAERQSVAVRRDRRVLDAVLAAHAGFCVAGVLAPSAPAHAAVTAAKRDLARAALRWLAQRLT